MKKGFLDGYPTYDMAKGHGNSDKWRKAFFGRMSKEEAAVLLKAQPETPHQLLNVAADATTEEIKKAFRQKMHDWHPDKNGHRLEEAEEKTKKLIAAYSLLMG